MCHTFAGGFGRHGHPHTSTPGPTLTSCIQIRAQARKLVPVLALPPSDGLRLGNSFSSEPQSLARDNGVNNDTCCTGCCEGVCRTLSAGPGSQGVFRERWNVSRPVGCCPGSDSQPWRWPLNNTLWTAWVNWKTNSSVSGCAQFLPCCPEVIGSCRAGCWEQRVLSQRPSGISSGFCLPPAACPWASRTPTPGLLFLVCKIGGLD